MTRRHVQALESAATRLRGHVAYFTRRGFPSSSSEATFARLLLASPAVVRVRGWRVGVRGWADPGTWSVECVPEVRRG